MNTTGRWMLPCLDAMGRDRYLMVTASRSGAALLFPPPASAALEPSHARTLAAVLDVVDRRGSHVQS
jgi:hypothetical protein